MSRLPSAIVLFGASGFIGRNLVDALSGRVEQLIGVTGSGKPVPGCNLTVSSTDLGSIAQLPDDTAVVHVASYRYDSQRFDLAQSDILIHNNTLSASVLAFCAERRIRELRMASSIAVYPGSLETMDDAHPVDLDAPPHKGEAFYAWSKRFAEVMAGLYADKFGINVMTFRLSNPFGAHDSLDVARAHVAPAFVIKALSDEPTFVIRGDPAVERDFVYAGDVVDVFVRSLERRRESGTYNIASGRRTTLQELAETCLRLAGTDKPIQAGAPGGFGPAIRRCTGARVQQEFGVTFRDLESGLRPTIVWYRNALRT